MEDAVLNVVEAAKLLNVSHDTIYRLARNGTIPGRKVGSQWRFPKAAVFAWLRDEAAAARFVSPVAVDSPDHVDPLKDESVQEEKSSG